MIKKKSRYIISLLQTNIFRSTVIVSNCGDKLFSKYKNIHRKIKNYLLSIDPTDCSYSLEFMNKKKIKL